MMKTREHMIKMARGILFFSFLLVLPLASSASELIYTIQTGTFLSAEDAKKQFDSIVEKSNKNDIDYLRIEKIGNYHSVRIGKFKNQNDAEEYLRKNDFQISEPLIRTAYIKDERIKEMYALYSLAGREKLYLDTSAEKIQGVADKKADSQTDPAQYAAVSVTADKQVPVDSVSEKREPLPASASELVYTIQTGSFLRSEDAKKQFDSIVEKSNKKGLDYLRIEKIGNYHSVRVGKFQDQISAEEYLTKNDFQTSRPLILNAYIKEERIEEMYAEAPAAEEETLSALSGADKSGAVVHENSVGNGEAEQYASVSPALYDQNVEDQVLADSSPVKGEPPHDDQTVNNLQDEIYAEVSPPDGEMPRDENVPADSASEITDAAEAVKPVDSTETEQYAAVAPSDDEMPVDEIVPADSASDMKEAVEAVRPVNNTGKEQYAAQDTTGENDKAEEKQHYAAEMMEDHELWEELGLDHIEEGEAVEYHFADIDPYTELSLGYRISGFDGMDRAFEYQDLKSFPTLHGDYEAFHYPNKYHVDVYVNTDNDYLADLRYGYKSAVNARLFNTTFMHNLEDIDLIDLDSTVASPGVTINDDDDKFWVRNGINHISFKYKNPSYHGHAFYEGLFVNKKGSQQQRSMAGSGFFNNMQRLSRNRNIDQMTMQNTVGVNGHLGPAEFELSHMEKRFNTKGEEELFDDYTATVSRPAGNFPHNQIPELKSSSNKFKIHTSYTGKLVAAASFTLKEKRNESSGANEDVFVGEGSVRWMPLLRLSLFLNYSHRDVDAENPSATSITDSAGSTTSYSTAVKPSVSSSTDNISLTARYRPEKGLTLRARYSYEHITRDNTGLWNLKDSTRKNALDMSADAKIMKGMKLKLHYMHKSVDKPSYNTEPYYRNRGMAAMTWIPVPRVNLLLSYSVERAERSELGFSETDTAKERDAKSDNILGSGTFQLRHNLSLSASYAYMRYEVKQDIVYEDLGSTETTDSGIPFTDTAHVYSASFNYMPINTLELLGRITHTRTDGEFEPKSENLTAPISIASFSRHKVRRTVYHLSGNYGCPNKFTCSFDIQYADVDDGLDNIYDSVEDSDAYIILLRLIRKWG